MDGSNDQGGRADDRIQGAAHRVQVRAVRPTEFTRDKRQTFLNTLAATCNVTTAARAAGINKTTADRLRRRSPDFARLWEDALEMGYRHLEEQLLARAIEGLDAMAIDPDAAPVAPLPALPHPLASSADAPDVTGEALPESGRRPVDGLALAAGGGACLVSGRGLPAAYQLALLILNQRRAARENGPRRLRRKALTTQEVDALLVQKLDRLDRLDAKRAARMAEASGSGVGEPGAPEVGDAA